MTSPAAEFAAILGVPLNTNPEPPKPRLPAPNRAQGSSANGSPIPSADAQRAAFVEGLQIFAHRGSLGDGGWTDFDRFAHASGHYLY